MTDLSFDPPPAPRRSLRANRGLRFAAIVIGSGIAGYFVGDWLADSQLLEAYDPAIQYWYCTQGPLGLACALVALILAMLGLAMAGFSLFPGAVRRAVKAEPGEDISRALATQRMGAVGAVAMAMMLGVFIMPGVQPMIGIIIFVVALALMVWASIALMKVSDELYVHVQMESWAWTGVILQLGIGAWAACAWLGVTPPLDPRGIILAMVIAGLATSAVVVARRGMIAE